MTDSVQDDPEPDAHPAGEQAAPELTPARSSEVASEPVLGAAPELAFEFDPASVPDLAPTPWYRDRRVALVPLGLALIAAGAWMTWSNKTDVKAAVFDPLGLRLVEGHAARIEAAARESDVDPILLAGIMFMESRGRGGQRSSADALGLMQLRMISARDAAKRLRLDEPVEEQVLNDDDLNVRLGAAHLAWLVENSEGWPLERILVSYNAGRVRMFRWEEAHGGWEGWVREQERRIAAGESTSGALSYARKAIGVMERLRERGAIAP